MSRNRNRRKVRSLKHRLERQYEAQGVPLHDAPPQPVSDEDQRIVDTAGEMFDELQAESRAFAITTIGMVLAYLAQHEDDDGFDRTLDVARLAALQARGFLDDRRAALVRGQDADASRNVTRDVTRDRHALVP